MSKEEHDEELRLKKGDEAKLQMALDESRRQSAAAASVSPVDSALVCVISITVFIHSFQHFSMCILFVRSGTDIISCCYSCCCSFSCWGDLF